jgi:CRISPR/Cas system-associated endonuclease Cas3-HD
LVLQKWGEVLGELHDLGKEQKNFQNYIRCVSGYEKKTYTHVNHAYVGALAAKKIYPKEYIFLSPPHYGTPFWIG